MPTLGETCALIHSELSEALEEYRRDRPAEYFGENGKPEDIVEPYSSMINLIYHIYARAELEGIDLDGIIERKHAYNVTRSYRHGGKRL